ncbi:MAG TPA: glucan biosynthesis protein G [Candidatus Binatia bacterium]|nr:glucan biosynthesis protein G [Candidatus Binatia bacterium]
MKRIRSVSHHLARPHAPTLGARRALVVLVLSMLVVTSSRAADPAPVATKPAATKPAKPAPFDFETLAQHAEKLAAADYQDGKGKVPDFLTSITYDQWRDIRYRPDRALWADKPGNFQVQFFHPGLFYDQPIAINVVSPEGVKPVPFSPSLFDYGRNDFASRVPPELGFGGFRIHFPINNPKYRDEVIVFLGASYFRAVGKDQMFGVSARGLALDTAESWGEEFPWFREFWLVRPDAKATSITVYALLDSPRVTGAYRFVVTPGAATRVDVESQLYLRKDVHKIGIAPLTSMFYRGENSLRSVVDFRPEVHDSDGVLMTLANGEWLWRPADNPERLRVSGLKADPVAGFGLLQRDRDFDHYQDLETAAERRPSVWQVPWGNWGPGRIEVVEIPTNSDTNDNLVSYWVADRELKPDKPHRFGYTQWWYADDPTRPPAGRVVATRRDHGTVENANRFVIDFAGGKLAKVPTQEVLHGMVEIQGGEQVAEIRDQHVVANPHVGGWRLSFQVVPKTRDPIEVRAHLMLGEEVLTETWSYAIVP